MNKGENDMLCPNYFYLIPSVYICTYIKWFTTDIFILDYDDINVVVFI